MCGHPGTQKRIPPQKEITYLDGLVRGVYAKYNLPIGQVLHDEDVYLAIPLQKGQISCRELMRGEVLLKPVEKDKPIMIDMIESPYADDEELKQIIFNRGI
jgi:sialic acid synthase SpsE